MQWYTKFAVLYIFVKLHVLCISTYHWITWIYWGNTYISNLLKMKHWHQKQLHCCMYHYNKFHWRVTKFCSFKELLRLFTAQKNLKMPWNFTLIYERNLVEVFLYLTTNLRMYVYFLVANCDAKLSVTISNFSKESRIKNKFGSMILEELFFCSLCVCHSVVSDSLRPHGL